MPDTPVFRSVFLQSPIGMVIIDQELIIRLANQAFLRLVQADPTEVSGKSILHLLKKDDQVEIKAAFRELSQSSAASFDMELIPNLPRKIQRPHSEWWRISCSPVQEGDSSFFVGFIQDITEQKAHETLLMKEKESANSAMKAAEKAARLKSEFLSTMSHEIRTPIHTIIGMGELLSETSLDEEQTDYTHQISFAADVLLELVSNVLDFSKIEAGKLSLEAIPFDLHHSLESAVSMLSLEAHKKGLDVGIYISPQVPPLVIGDPVRLRQIVVNLFNNAVKFTEQGHIILSCTVPGSNTAELRFAGESPGAQQVTEVRSAIADSSGADESTTTQNTPHQWLPSEPVEIDELPSAEFAHISMSITDTGIGIDPEKQSALFREFSQIDSSTTRRFGGSGLGLSITKRLVELMNGSIWVQSTPGSGSVFTVDLPLPLPESDPGDLESFRATPPQPSPTPGTSSQGGKQILIIEDNPTLRQILSLYLAEGGYRIFQAESGETALHILHSQVAMGEPLDAALIDLSLPGIDGWQLASEINSDKTINQTRLVLMSPRGTGSSEAKMKLLHWFDDYLGKPVQRRDLFNTLASILSQDGDLEVLEEPSTEPTDAPDHHALPQEWKGKKILVAEDTMVNRLLFQTILQKLGFTVVEAEDGKQAVEAAQFQEFDLIFMDLHMPHINGYQASEYIRAIHPWVPIIAATANAIKGEREKCLASGMSDMLVKPFRKDDVLAILHKWITVSEFTSPASSEPSTTTPKDRPGAPEKVSSKEQIFDSADLLDTFMNQKETVKRVLQGYLQRGRDQIESISQFAADQKMEELQQEAHALKGSSLGISAPAMADLALAIEEAAKLTETQIIQTKVQKLAPTLETLETQIEDFLDSL